ncbi:hypothetical protein MRB53_038681 [Persea americana]|nr:hypothetical protein MRB53_038681 [Persea americana]
MAAEAVIRYSNIRSSNAMWTHEQLCIRFAMSLDDNELLFANLYSHAPAQYVYPRRHGLSHNTLQRQLLLLQVLRARVLNLELSHGIAQRRLDLPPSVRA